MTSSASKKLVKERRPRVQSEEEKEIDRTITAADVELFKRWSFLNTKIYRLLGNLYQLKQQEEEKSGELDGLDWYMHELTEVKPDEYEIARGVYADYSPNIIKYFTSIKQDPQTILLTDDDGDRFIMDPEDTDEVTWISSSDFSQYDKKTGERESAEAVCVVTGDIKYIVSPRSTMFGITVDLAAPTKWISKAVQHFHSFIDKNNTSRDYIRVYTGELWNMDMKEPSFKLPEGFAVFEDAIENELKLLESILGTDKTRKVMFYGTPGTGKTTAAERLIRIALRKKVQTVIVTNMNGLTDLYNNIPRPALIILEDFDMATQQRGSSSRGVVSDVLQALSTDLPGIITLATSNNCEGLDSASIRAGRIDKAYYFGYPDATIRLEIAKRMCKRYKQRMAKPLREFVTDNKYNLTGAIIETVVKEKHMLADIGISVPFDTVIADFIKHTLSVEFQHPEVK